MKDKEVVYWAIYPEESDLGNTFQLTTFVVVLFLVVVACSIAALIATFFK